MGFLMSKYAGRERGPYAKMGGLNRTTIEEKQ